MRRRKSARRRDGGGIGGVVSVRRAGVGSRPRLLGTGSWGKGARAASHCTRLVAVVCLRAERHVDTLSFFPRSRRARLRNTISREKRGGSRGGGGVDAGLYRCPSPPPPSPSPPQEQVCVGGGGGLEGGFSPPSSSEQVRLCQHRRRHPCQHRPARHPRRRQPRLLHPFRRRAREGRVHQHQHRRRRHRHCQRDAHPPCQHRLVCRPVVRVSHHFLPRRPLQLRVARVWHSLSIER